jgi:hypothetical protein
MCHLARMDEDALIEALNEPRPAVRTQLLRDIATAWTAADPHSERQRIKELVDSIEETQTTI